jgi:hypothetical protein
MRSISTNSIQQGSRLMWMLTIKADNECWHCHQCGGVLVRPFNCWKGCPPHPQLVAYEQWRKKGSS